jgi:hypothetical protein
MPPPAHRTPAQADMTRLARDILRSLAPRSRSRSKRTERRSTSADLVRPSATQPQQSTVWISATRVFLLFTLAVVDPTRDSRREPRQRRDAALRGATDHHPCSRERRRQRRRRTHDTRVPRRRRARRSTSAAGAPSPSPVSDGKPGVTRRHRQGSLPSLLKVGSI